MSDVSSLPVPAAAAARRRPREASLGQVSIGMRVAHLIVVILPLLGTAAALALLWGRYSGWREVGLLVGMYVLTGLGITVGFHRHFAHRAFAASPALRFALTALGSMAVEGPLFVWVAQHRRHHHHSDSPGDPHSPHGHGPGIVGLLRGMWHAHLGWTFALVPSGLDHYVRDLRRSRALRVADALFPLWVAVGLLVPAALGGLLAGSWSGALLGLLWGGLVRMFLLHHVTWSVNSVCHIWGSRPFRTADQSRDNVVFGVLALGEGWHNGHHAFPTSARHGLRWWQIDVSYYVIRVLAWLRLAWEVRVPSRESQAARRESPVPVPSPPLN